ncbi:MULTISPECIES: YdcF family protein [Protofrankia]|uniref:DUF218 domain-containing protein n=1 Tax=Candidatus Protofrankia datiscae TaxID=2716812 RepID=F8B4P2_9ACTN|nr:MULTISPECIES: YdcF family protein [Protofrankia]AEH09094.1 protein of unknown function DUF218 [Candidatus Protofrankia datiscae]
MVTIPRPWTARWLHARWWVWLLRVVAILVLAGVMISVFAMIQIWVVGRSDDQRRSDVLIVLGASQFNGRPSAVFAARLDHALALYRAGVAPRIVTVGGSQVGDVYTEARAAANYLVSRGVPASAVVVVGEGRDTLGSLRAVARIMAVNRWRSAVVVTDPWHSLRSRTIARDLDIDAVTSPATTGPTTRGIATTLRYILREGAAYRFYQLFHRATPVGAAPGAL